MPITVNPEQDTVQGSWYELIDASQSPPSERAHYTLIGLYEDSRELSDALGGPVGDRKQAAQVVQLARRVQEAAQALVDILERAELQHADLLLHLADPQPEAPEAT